MIGRHRHRHPPAPERRGNRNDEAGIKTELRLGAERLAPLDYLPMTKVESLIALSNGPTSAPSGDRMIARHVRRHPSKPERREKLNDQAGSETQLRLGADRLGPLDILPMTTAKTLISHSKGPFSTSSGNPMIGRHGLRQPPGLDRRGNRNDEVGHETGPRLGAGRLAPLDNFPMTAAAERIAPDRPARSNRSGGSLNAAARWDSIHHRRRRSPVPATNRRIRAFLNPAYAEIANANSYMERKPE